MATTGMRDDYAKMAAGNDKIHISGKVMLLKIRSEHKGGFLIQVEAMQKRQVCDEVAGLCDEVQQ